MDMIYRISPGCFLFITDNTPAKIRISPDHPGSIQSPRKGPDGFGLPSLCNGITFLTNLPGWLIFPGYPVFR